MPTSLSRLAVCAGSILFFAGEAIEVTRAQEAPPRRALHRLTVGGNADRVVVELASDLAIVGRLQTVGTPATRLFVDLRGIVPEVPDVTDVNLGAVRRVRVALNRARPPVTRVVLDLTETARYRLEQGPTPNEIRITVEPERPLPATRAEPLRGIEASGSYRGSARPAQGAPGEAHRPVRAGSAAAQPGCGAGRLPGGACAGPLEPETASYSAWFTGAVRALARLIEQTTDARPNPAGDPRDDERMVLEWSALQEYLITGNPPPTLEAAHALLLTAGAVGHAAVTMAHEHLSAADLQSAVAGAAMLLRQAEQLAAPDAGGDSGRSGQLGRAPSASWCRAGR